MRLLSLFQTRCVTPEAKQKTHAGSLSLPEKTFGHPVVARLASHAGLQARSIPFR